MQHEVNGEMVEIPNEDILKNFKNDKAYNDEVDRIVDGRVNTFKTEITTTNDTALSQLKSDHATELEAAKNVNSGKKDLEIQGLTTQIGTLTKTMKGFEDRALQAEQNGKLGALKTSLASAMSGVPDDFVRDGHINQAMSKAKINGDVVQFELSTGAFGGVAEMISEIQTGYPQHFASKQPNGNGVKGGALTGPNLLAAALGGDMASKMAYAKEHGMPAYLAEVEKAALQNT